MSGFLGGAKMTEGRQLTKRANMSVPLGIITYMNFLVAMKK